VLIAGVTGSGKTTLARRLAVMWNLRHVELDALFQRAGAGPWLSSRS
jgi:adenylate kinase family enzyme